MIDPSLAAAKHALRLKMRERLRRLSSAFRAEASLVICELAARQESFRAARCVALFSPLPTEPGLQPLMEEAWAEKKQVALPRLWTVGGQPCLAWHRVETWADLTDDGPFGLREPSLECPPVEPTALAAIFVPGMAFDHRGGRLGRGGGYYDRFLAGINSDVPRFGLMFQLQRVDEVPMEPHDHALAAIITEEGLCVSTDEPSGRVVRSIQPPPTTSSPT